MADLSDVEKALVDAVIACVFPNGTSAQSVIGGQVRVFRGWPPASGLNADLAAGIPNVSVFSIPDATVETTRYARLWRQTTCTAPTLSVALAGGVATFGATGGSGQNAGLLVDGVGYAVAVQADDTPQTVAASLAALIPGAVATGASVSIPGDTIDAARVEASAMATMETRRQEQEFSVIVWCADPLVRDALTGGVDAGLSAIDWLALADGTAGRLVYRATSEADNAENANLFRRDLRYRVEYPTILTASVPAMLFGVTQVTAGSSLLQPVTTGSSAAWPQLGAIRFDAWYDPSNAVDQQCASALSSPAWVTRMPPDASLDAQGVVSWPLADQTVLDAEIRAAVAAGLSFWAFDSYPAGGLSRALSLYLSSTIRSSIGFCMLGQSSAWADTSTGNGYSASLMNDIAMMAEAGYVRVLGGRPLYLVLDASAEQLAGLPAGGVPAAIADIRALAAAQGSANPYVVWLSGAALADYDNVAAAMAAGADAAAAYACPRLDGAPQGFAALTGAASTDWATRAATGFPFIPTAMTGWDQRPLIERPQPFYPLSPYATPQSYYETGQADDIAAHIASMAETILAQPAACPVQVGLIYAWNELAEGGWLMPTLAALPGSGGPAAGPAVDASRVWALGAALGAVRRRLATALTTIEAG